MCFNSSTTYVSFKSPMSLQIKDSFLFLQRRSWTLNFGKNSPRFRVWNSPQIRQIGTNWFLNLVFPSVTNLNLYKSLEIFRSLNLVTERNTEFRGEFGFWIFHPIPLNKFFFPWPYSVAYSPNFEFFMFWHYLY
jgi:hypothetical protein